MSNRHLRILLVVVLAGVLALVGCASGPGVPRDPADVPGYRNPPPDLTGVDPSALAGRRILIDPGHGGHFRGATGDGGLSEAEVNLGVALYLQGLLQWAGAEVHLTRTADVDFLSPADSSLTADLAARVALCDSLQPDIFLSIHHNSTASRDPDINETQTYYPLGREGADRDLARAIHGRLVQALEIEPAKILPGGFYVLRNAPVPAVLGEPAMISNPVIEGRLSLARSLELEASAYFLGLRDYFAGGMPRWTTDLPDTVTSTPAAPGWSWRFESGRDNAPGLDPTSITVFVDGNQVAHHLSADGQVITIDDSSVNAATEVAIRGRNLAGRATPEQRHHCDMADRSAMAARFIAESGPAPYRGLMTYAGAAADLADLAPLTLVRDGGDIALPAYSGRRGWAFLQALPKDLNAWSEAATFADRAGRRHEARMSIEVMPEGIAWVPLAAPIEHWPAQPVPGNHWRRRSAPDPFVTRYGESSWPAIAHRRDTPLWLEADGAHPMFVDASADLPAEGLAWRPLLPELIGLRVALDARGGGGDDQGIGPLGTRGSDLNLNVARRLAALLRGAGCDVALVRDDEIWVPDPERVRRADTFGADFYLAIGRGAPAVKHHHGSSMGAPWAARCADAISPLLADTIPAIAAYDYVLRHTACPAILVDLEEPAEVGTERRLGGPAWQDAMARAIFRGTISLLEPSATFVAVDDLLAALGDRGLPRDRLDLVRLDGNFVWLAPSGQPTSPPVPSWGTGDPGLPCAGDVHMLELHAGPHWQLWILDRLPSGDWHGRVFLENR